jgi:ABC-type dipeptide/oligopeptide/nickel transport system permease component
MIGVYFANLFVQSVDQALEIILVLLNDTLRICIIYAFDAEIGEISLSGLNDPLPVQYWNWISGVLQGDMGHSLRTRESVLHVIVQRLGPILGAGGRTRAEAVRPRAKRVLNSFANRDSTGFPRPAP